MVCRTMINVTARLRPGRRGVWSCLGQLGCCLVALWIASQLALAQPAAEAPAADPVESAVTDPSPAEGSPWDQLANQQTTLAEKYQRLEMLMLKMAEFDASTNPRRAALLKQALSESKDKQVRLQMETLATRLRQQQLQRAVDDQTQVRDDLRILLELLLSENREDQLRNEQARVRQYLQELERILRQQRSVQGRTEGGEDPLQLAKDQDQVADRTGELAQTIEQNERAAASQGATPGGEADPAPASPQNPADAAEPKPDEGPPGGAKPDKDEAGEETPAADAPQDQPKPEDQDADDSAEPAEPDQPAEPGEGPPPAPPGDAQPGDTPGNPSPASPAQGQPSPGTPGSDGGMPAPPTPPPPAPPGQQRIAQAEQKMRQAQQRLEEAERAQAVKEQEEARRLLEEAKAELEEILRQMREEEIQRSLALLEGRFRTMLEAQLKIYEETQRLSRIPDDKRDSQLVIQAGKLSLEQRRLVGEADKALLLLREEGSSVAFPETVEQLRADMDQVAERLAQVQVERITLGLEEDIIAALEEMIEALQKAIQEAEQRQQQPNPPQSADPEDQPLVNAIAELKMIRALQMRVNTRTERYARLLDDPEHPVGQATSDDLVQSLLRLAEREARIRQITRDIVLGKNQ